MSIWARWWLQHRWRWKLNACKDSESLFLHKTNGIKETLTCIFARGRWWCFLFPSVSPSFPPSQQMVVTGEPELGQDTAQYFNITQNQRWLSWNSCWHLKPLRNDWAVLYKGKEGWKTWALLPIRHAMICFPSFQTEQDPHITSWEWPCSALWKC